MPAARPMPAPAFCRPPPTPDDPDPLERFEARAAAYYPVLIEDLGADDAGDTGYAACGSLTVAIDDAEVAHLARSWPACAAGGRQGSRLRRDRAGRGERAVPAARRRSGRDPLGRGARVDGRLLAGRSCAPPTQRGLEVRRAAVDDLVVKRRRRRRRAQRGRADRLRAGRDRGRRLVEGVSARTLGIDIPRGAAARPDRPPRAPRHRHRRLADRRRLSRPLHRALGRRPPRGRRDARDRVGFAADATAAGLIEVLCEALRVAPGLAEAEIREIRVGLRPASPGRTADPRPGAGHPQSAAGHGPRRGRPAARAVQRQGGRRIRSPAARPKPRSPRSASLASRVLLEAKPWTSRTSC